MLKNKVAVVTGGSRGIGRAIVLKMAENGADIALVYASNREAAAIVETEVQQLGRRVQSYCCDVSCLEQTEAVAKQILADFGGVDILVNNAGIVRDGLILSMKEQDFDQVLITNLKGAYHMIKQFYPHFMRRRSGRIINLSSVVGLSGNAGQANYAAAKAGVIGLTKSTRKSLRAGGLPVTQLPQAVLRRI